MPVKPVKKKKTKKVRYRKITFKITDSQKKLLEKVSKQLKTTPNRLMKKAIREYLLRYKDTIAANDAVTANQLKLFDDDIFEDDDADDNLDDGSDENTEDDDDEYVDDEKEEED